MTDSGTVFTRSNGWYRRFARLLDGSLTFRRFDAILARAKSRGE